MGPIKAIVATTLLLVASAPGRAAPPAHRAAPAPALAEVRAEISGLMAKLEANLSQKDTFETGEKIDGAFAETFTKQFDDIIRVRGELNNYCSGTFDEPEYTRRTTYCRDQRAQLDAKWAEVDGYARNSLSHYDLMQHNLQDNKDAREVILIRLQGAIESYAKKCLRLLVGQRSTLCHLPPAGPASAKIMDKLDALFTNAMR